MAKHKHSFNFSRLITNPASRYCDHSEWACECGAIKYVKVFVPQEKAE